MNNFFHEENLKVSRDRLNETTDPEQRRVPLKLLADEAAKDERAASAPNTIRRQGRPPGLR
jgi:hypothetical protein